MYHKYHRSDKCRKNLVLCDRRKGRTLHAHIHAKNEFFSREGENVYRNGEVYRDTIDRNSGAVLDSQLIRTNHAKVMYDCPPEMVKASPKGEGLNS